jgi:hypothetical protein
MAQYRKNWHEGAPKAKVKAIARKIRSQQPRWPAGAPGGRGGEFAPKDATSSGDVRVSSESAAKLLPAKAGTALRRKYGQDERMLNDRLRQAAAVAQGAKGREGDGPLSPRSTNLKDVRKSSEMASKVLGAKETTNLRRRYPDERELNDQLIKAANVKIAKPVRDFLAQIEIEKDDLALELIGPKWTDKEIENLKTANPMEGYKPSPKMIRLIRELRSYGPVGYEIVKRTADQMPA